ncbi:MAG TPA: M81 family metallopeptidase [Acetobacteraceae bacterium]|nr:M81 family metallopeptidase [Acetobacteraceae bacterium]
MPRILIAECMQEISSFNPIPSDYGYFHIQRGEQLLHQRGLNTAVGGALQVFEAAGDVTLVPTYGARSGSAGLLSAAGWRRLSSELLDAVAARIKDVDAAFISLHGAMGADGELDPEGYLLEHIRELAGPDVPIVISLDLHGILTERMLRQVDGLAIYHTYPHVDFADTGARAARVLLDIVARRLHPVIARVTIPALVRGDELITRTGCYGDLIREARRLEQEGKALAAGVMIGNPFTDVPELCSQVIIMAEQDGDWAADEAVRLAREFWPLRHRMQGKLIALDRAIAQAKWISGPIVFTDAADATSSGATGDSNVIIKALHDAGTTKRVLAQIMDPEAAKAAHAAGVGASITVRLGGALDRRRFTPMKVTATVESLSRGLGRFESMRAAFDAGPTAVLSFGNFTVVVISRTVGLIDRALYYANGLDPRNYDLIVVKCPHTEYQMYDAWVEKNFNIDAPGATSADLLSLGHTICTRPIYPLDDGVTFEPTAVLFRRT